MTNDTCSNCGAPLPDGSPIYVISELDVPGLFGLFNREFDEERCEACGHPVGIRPTVAVVLSEPIETLLAFGSRVDEIQREDCLTGLQGAEIVPEEVASLDDLRSGAAARLKTRIDPLNRWFMAVAEGNEFEYALAHWKTLTPEVFAAGCVLVMSPVPGVSTRVFTNAGNEEPSIYDVLPGIAKAQARSWLALCLSWVSGEEHSPTLEEDLQRYVDPGVIVPGSVERLFELLDPLMANPDIMDDMRYLLEAVHASIRAAAKESNPRADQWAEYFFGLELGCLVVEEVPPNVRAIRTSEERAQKTVGYRGAWDAATRRINEFSYTEDENRELGLLEQLDTIASKAGYPSLINEMLGKGLEIRAPENVPLAFYVDAMKFAVSKLRSTEDVLLSPFRHVARLLVQQRRIEDLEQFAEEALELMGGSRDAQARMEAWLGEHLKIARQPRRFLDRVGDTPRAWEYDLSARRKIDLWTERSNALRLLERQEEALGVAQEVLDLFAGMDDPENWRSARLNLAILQRDTGSPDAALSTLHALLDEAEDQKEKISVLESLAVTYSILGRPRNALTYVDEAIELSAGPWAFDAPRYKAYRALLLVGEGREREAAETLLDNELDEHAHPFTVLSQAAAWVMILDREPSLLPREGLPALSEHVVAMLKEAGSSGDTQTDLAMYKVSAWLAEVLEFSEAQKVWQSAYNMYEAAGRPQEPEILVSLARYAYERGDTEEARSHLRVVHAALAASFGGVEDLSVAVGGTVSLPPVLDKLAATAFFNSSVQATWEDRRLISELHRDAIGRARMAGKSRLASDSDPMVELDLADEAIRRLAPDHGTLAVVEWIATHGVIGCFVTTITDAGEVSSYWLAAPPVNVYDVAKRMSNRLKNWYPGRPGDPFDLPAWQELERWLVDQLTKHLRIGDHVVFLEHKDFAGLPWHVAASTRWTSSYATGWSVLLSLGERSESPNKPTIGVVMVPRFGESPEVSEALEASSQHTEGLAASQQLPFVSATNHSSDNDHFREVLEQAHVAKVLCHGFVDAEGEVALMLAHDGSLPLADSVAAGSEVGRRYRMSWRTLQHLSAAPTTVFSAACSSGIVRSAGLGERLGVFNALRQSGTRSMVAPWWDIIASSVLPVLDDVFERHVRGGEPLAHALHEACTVAEKDRPRWLAWALALEGDWR